MNDQQLMQFIQAKWGGAIAAACAATKLPPSFLAALIANESNGNPDAQRFEKNVLAAIWEVLLGRKAAYGSIGRADLVGYLAGAASAILTVPAVLPTDALQRLDGLATSWGLTQVMGYEAIAFHLNGVEKLKAPGSSLAITMTMLVQFAARNNFDFSSNFAELNNLDFSSNFAELFDCWNTGRPHSPTFDPKYIPNGLARMRIYDALPVKTDPVIQA